MPRKNFANQGFSLVETAIVLLIAGFLIAGAFQLMTSLQQQRNDQASANEMRTVVVALEKFLTEQQGAITANAPLNLPDRQNRLTDAMQLRINGANTPGLTYFQQNYLPVGLDLATGRYVIGIYRLPNIAGVAGGRPVLKGLVLRTPPTTMTESRLARIASLIGPQGGLVRANGASSQVVGLQDSWSVNPAQYSLNGLFRVGQIAAYTNTTESRVNTNIISRVDTGNPESNTMRTDIVMGDTTGRSQTYAVRNTSGYGQTRTNARVNTDCGRNIAPIDLLDEDGNLFPDGKKLQADNMMIVTGLDDADQPAVLQCMDNGGGIFQWKKIGGIIYGTELNHRAFFELRDADAFPAQPRTGDICTGDGGYCASDTWDNFKLRFNNANLNAWSVTNPPIQRREMNKWFYNDTGRPLVISMLFSDRADWAWIYARDNYDSSTGIASGGLRILSVIKSRDNDGAYSLIAVIPINAAFAVGFPRAQSWGSRLEYWAEYNAY